MSVNNIKRTVLRQYAFEVLRKPQRRRYTSAGHHIDACVAKLSRERLFFGGAYQNMMFDMNRIGVAGELEYPPFDAAPAKVPHCMQNAYWVGHRTFWREA